MQSSSWNDMPYDIEAISVVDLKLLQNVMAVQRSELCFHGDIALVVYRRHERESQKMA